MPTSEARILANQKNAQLSSGPKTLEGKERSRRNALKHGLAGSGIVLIDEDIVEVERRHDELQAELAPSSNLGKILVRDLATQSVRMERAGREESAAIAERVRHAVDAFDLDQPGKDSWRHRQAGAREVMIAGGARWALLHEVVGSEPTLADLLGRLAPVDLVLVEGFKATVYPKIEVFRAGLGRPPLWPERPDILAVACDGPPGECDRVVLPLDRPDEVADWVVRQMPVMLQCTGELEMPGGGGQIAGDPAGIPG